MLSFLRLWGLACLLIVATAWGEEKNPFPVEAKVQVDDKVLDPAPTADEKEKIATFARAMKDGARVEGPARDQAWDARGEILKRLVSAPLKWTDEDLKARIKVTADLSTSHLYSTEMTRTFREAVYTFVASKDDDPNNLVHRMQTFSQCPNPGNVHIKWRAIVNLFLGNAKYKDATAQQKYDFVHGWLMAKLPAGAAPEVEELCKDLKADTVAKK